MEYRALGRTGIKVSAIGLGTMTFGEQTSQSLPVMNTLSRATCLTCALLLAACARQDGAPAAWVGKWQGPEGTWLQVDRAEGAYTVTIRNLDAARTFPATVSGNSLHFQRDGVDETLHATDGRGTGMKWLAEKSTCLAVRPGEGFCRD